MKTKKLLSYLFIIVSALIMGSCGEDEQCKKDVENCKRKCDSLKAEIDTCENGLEPKPIESEAILASCNSDEKIYLSKPADPNFKARYIDFARIGNDSKIFIREVVAITDICSRSISATDYLTISVGEDGTGKYVIFNPTVDNTVYNHTFFLQYADESATRKKRINKNNFSSNETIKFIGTDDYRPSSVTVPDPKSPWHVVRMEELGINIKVKRTTISGVRKFEVLTNNTNSGTTFTSEFNSALEIDNP